MVKIFPGVFKKHISKKIQAIRKWLQLLLLLPLLFLSLSLSLLSFDSTVSPGLSARSSSLRPGALDQAGRGSAQRAGRHLDTGDCYTLWGSLEFVEDDCFFPTIIKPSFYEVFLFSRCRQIQVLTGSRPEPSHDLRKSDRLAPLKNPGEIVVHYPRHLITYLSIIIPWPKHGKLHTPTWKRSIYDWWFWDSQLLGINFNYCKLFPGYFQKQIQDLHPKIDVWMKHQFCLVPRADTLLQWLLPVPWRDFGQSVPLLDWPIGYIEPTRVPKEQVGWCRHKLGLVWEIGFCAQPVAANLWALVRHEGRQQCPWSHRCWGQR